jgi:hypothetical protein
MTRRQKLLRIVAIILITLTLTTSAVEAFLWFVDPLGIATYIYDQNSIVTIADAEGYTLDPGEHAMRYWTFTIDSEGNRVLPPSDSDCLIRFVGDSVTFGESVNDDETFAYKTALAYPDVRFINEAKMGYNLGNIMYLVNNLPADGYIYLVSDNDDGAMWARPPENWGERRILPPRQSAFRSYLLTLQQIQTPPAPPDMEAFWRDFDVLWNRDDVLIIALESPLSAQIAERYPALNRIPWFPHRVSWIDGHPTPAGHDHILEHIEPYLREFIPTRCSA